MRRKRFGEEQIVSILKESAARMKTEEVFGNECGNWPTNGHDSDIAG